MSQINEKLMDVTQELFVLLTDMGAGSDHEFAVLVGTIGTENSFVRVTKEAHAAMLDTGKVKPIKEGRYVGIQLDEPYFILGFGLLENRQEGHGIEGVRYSADEMSLASHHISDYLNHGVAAILPN